jgi:hypothetical protein
MQPQHYLTRGSCSAQCPSLAEQIYSAQKASFSDMEKAFYDIGGNPSFGYGEYEQPPAAWFRPTLQQPLGVPMAPPLANQRGPRPAGMENNLHGYAPLYGQPGISAFPEMPGFENRLVHGLRPSCK